MFSITMPRSSSIEYIEREGDKNLHVMLLFIKGKLNNKVPVVLCQIANNVIIVHSQYFRVHDLISDLLCIHIYRLY